MAQDSTSLLSPGLIRILAMCSLSWRPTLIQFSPPSIDLETTSPTETLLRTHDSPVPTQTFLGFEGSTATAPMDCTLSRSKTGLKVVPPFTDFQTPPLAAPAKTVMRPFSSMASIAAMRPLIVAEPILRADRPETVAASKRYAACAEAKAVHSEVPAKINIIAKTLRADRFMVVSPFPEKLNETIAKNRDAKSLDAPVNQCPDSQSRLSEY